MRATVASGAILKSVNSNPGYWLTLIAGGLTLLGTVLAGAQTFYKFGDIAEAHRAAATNYDKSRDKCDSLLIHLEADGPFNAEAERQPLAGLMKEIGDLDTGGPGINGGLYDRIFRRFSNDKRPIPKPRPA